MHRREFLHRCVVAGSSIALSGCGEWQLNAGRRPNLLFITADDMSFNSLGCTGNDLPGISPNVDRLASEGLLIDHGHVPVPICGPSRAAWITGTWPQRNGTMGHYRNPPKWFTRPSIPTTLPELLRHEAGYYTGVIAKNPTTTGWDFEAKEQDTGLGRDPSKYEELTRGFIETAVQQGKPFFLHPNSSDTHEYWAGQEYETKEWVDAMMEGRDYETYPNGKPYPDPDVNYSADEIPVPPCWPDNEAIRADIRTYFNSVRRLDQTVGAILRAVRDTGQEDNTLVVFLSDGGIGRAFAKWSLYPMGTRTPIIVKWPGVVEPGRHDRSSVLSAIDVAPTFLAAAGVGVPEFMDARPFLNIIRDTGRGEARDKVFACFDYMNNYPEADDGYPTYTRDLADKFDNYRPMRAIHSTDYAYIWNGWADGENQIPMEMSSSQTIRRILMETGHEDRAEFEAYRTREEFYDTVNDPGCLVNLVGEPTLAHHIDEFRAELLRTMEQVDDHELPNYRADLEAPRTAGRRVPAGHSDILRDAEVPSSQIHAGH